MLQNTHAGLALRYLALNHARIAVTSSPRLSREYVCVASDQRKERQTNRVVERKYLKRGEDQLIADPRLLINTFGN